MSDEVTTPEDCLRFVNEVQLCTWRHQLKYSWLPSLEMATPWRGFDLTMQTWFWKDDLHTERKLYFGMLLAPDIPVFVSLAFLPTLIAAQGDNDARTLYEKGQLASNALHIYEHIERNGLTATRDLPWLPGSRMLYLNVLQQKFLLTKHEIMGRTRATYGYKWGLCQEAFPGCFEQAARLSVEEARRNIFQHLKKLSPDLTEEKTAKLFRWQAI